MDTITKPFYAFMNWIDSGEFFRKPLQWLYILCGVISFCIPLVALYVFYEGFAKQTSHYIKGWDAVAFWITGILLAITIIIFAIYCFLFWFNRYKKLNLTFKKGDQIVAIPIWGHWIQTTFEFWGLFLAAVPTFFIFFSFFYNFISFKTSFFSEIGTWATRNEFFGYFVGLLTAIVGIIISFICIFIVAYLILLIGHVIGEKLRARANVANDTRDMGDILRGTVLKDENN